MVVNTGARCSINGAQEAGTERQKQGALQGATIELAQAFLQKDQNVEYLGVIELLGTTAIIAHERSVFRSVSR